jgi:hypothetical protein
MQADKYFAITQMKKRAETGYATGQKNYAQARQRAAQFNGLLSEMTSAKADALQTDGAASKIFLSNQIIHNGAHHANK